MNIYKNLFTNYHLNENGIITIGYFDSIHLGHKKILKELVDIANQKKLTPFVLTYNNLPHKDKNNKSILEISKKLEEIEKIGIKNIILCDFNRDFSSTKPNDFIKILKNNFNINSFVIGKDFGFGKNKEGNAENLKKNGSEIFIVEPFFIDNYKVTTSLIRDSILDGNIELANKLIGIPFYIEGIVVKGKQLGRTIGFPTMNFNNDKIIYPKTGSYATKTFVNNKEFFSMTYVSESIIETNLFNYVDFDYDFKIKVDFFIKIRDNASFSTVDELKEQLKKDQTVTKNYFGIS